MTPLFVWLAELTIQRARSVVVVCVVLLGLCGVLASSLTINSSRHTMVSADQPEQAQQQAYFDRFGMPDALLIVVSGLDAPARQELVAAIAAELAGDPALADRVLARADASTFAELMLLQPLWTRAEGVDERNYLVSSDGQRHFVVVYPPPSASQQAHEVSDVVAKVRAARDVVAAVLTPTDALPPLDLPALGARAALPGANDSGPWMRAQATAQAIVARGHYLPTDLPPVLRHEFVSRDGAAIGLQVIPRGDIWDPQVARRFADAVREVAPQATGLAMQIEAHLRYIREGFVRAAIASALLVLLGVSLAFRSVRDGVLAMLPSLLGFVWMLGLMGWSGVELDAANIVALPLILGIGVDAGVHLVERVRQDSGSAGPARVADVVGGTGSAVLVSSLTTMVGFAALMLADYGAMFSLGLVMTIGVGSTLTVSLVGLPALLVLMRRAR